MATTGRLLKRVETVAATEQQRAVRRYLAESASELGVDPAELWAEAEALTRRCQEAGATTPEEQIALVARLYDLPVDELTAALEHRAARPDRQVNR